MKIVDLFAGVGGLSQGFIKAGFEVILAIEHDKLIANAYQFNHPTTTVISEDIESIEYKRLENYLSEADVIVGGPPCQGFSQKGKRLSLNDDRNFLFKYYVDIVKIAKPKFFVLENVPNIFTTLDGYFKSEIIEMFNKIGYDVSAKVLNAADFGIPQQRKRAFF